MNNIYIIYKYIIFIILRFVYSFQSRVTTGYYAIYRMGPRFVVHRVETEQTLIY